MILGEDEEKILSELEKQFSKNDPKLYEMMSNSLDSGKSRESLRFSPHRISLGIIGLVIGLSLIMLGTSIGLGTLGLVLALMGFSAMVASFIYAISKEVPGIKKRDTSNLADKKKYPKKSSQGSRWNNYLNEQKKKWDERG